MSDTPEIAAEDLPEDSWDRAFVLAHRWGLDAATPVTISAVGNRTMVATVTCLAASPASLVAMKLQSAPRRPVAPVHKAANDYLDLQRLLANAALVPEIVQDLTTGALTILEPGPSNGSGSSSSSAPTKRLGLSDGAGPPMG